MSEKIKNILMEHCGRKNAITSKKISEIMGFPMEDTQSVSRQEIWNTAEEYRLPLVSCKKGYFIAQNADELKAFNDDYEKRIKGMEEKRDMVNKYYEERKNEICNKE